uniref:S-formylglutathione hydrolase n=1 Tax=Hucho hucho TaxID=62062 RepID=A0A4W5PFS0_9TELE
MALTQVSSNKCSGGYQVNLLKCKMKFAIYLPPKAENGKCPVFYWVSGLTCTKQNLITKAGSQHAASEYGIIIIAPDTSPRGCNIKGEGESWDFGTGAGFYVNATQEPWKSNYRMYAYVTEEVLRSFFFFSQLPHLINANFPTDPEKMSISGHSMGGHGALICTLKNPGIYNAWQSVFAPICNPSQKAFNGYLGKDKKAWEAYDAMVLSASYSGPQLDILIDQGSNDQFLSASQLLPDNVIASCSEKKIPVVFRLQLGYDHSYYFINDNIKHHAKFLNA